MWESLKRRSHRKVSNVKIKECLKSSACTLELSQFSCCKMYSKHPVEISLYESFFVLIHKNSCMWQLKGSSWKYDLALSSIQRMGDDRIRVYSKKGKSLTFRFTNPSEASEWYSLLRNQQKMTLSHLDSCESTADASKASSSVKSRAFPEGFIKGCGQCSGTAAAEWVCLQCKVSYCESCAGIHRSFPHHRVKSILLDFWTEAEIEKIMQG
eukprot:Sdes_comp20330_c0_seq1m14021